MEKQSIRVGSINDLQPGQMKRLDLGSLRLLLANVSGEFLVTDDNCTHEEASLSTGCLRGNLVKCPLHGSRFDLHTGEALDDPAEEALKTYPVEIHGDDIFIIL